MNPGSRFVIALGAAACLLATGSLRAESNSLATGKPILSPPLPPSSKSPTDLFRELLAAPLADRTKLLLARPEPSRKVIEKALREYEALAPSDRELRLQTLELGWYLEPLLRTAPVARSNRLASVPESVRHKVEQRLEVWDQLPAEAQAQLLENAQGIRLMLGTAPSAAPSTRATQDIVRVEALSEGQRHRLLASFELLFKLNDREKEEILRGFSEAQRGEMRQALLALKALPKPQRDLCLDGLTKFSSLTPDQRREFLKNCERWNAMTPAQKAAWRQLVAGRSKGPPLPPGMSPPTSQPSLPPLPPTPRKSPSLATND